MSKRNITISVDGEVIEELRQLRLNISGEINTFLHALLARNTGNIDGINIKMEKIELEKVIRKLTFNQSKKVEIETRIRQYEERQEEIKKKKLEEEKKKIEEAESCLNCGQVMGTDFKRVKMGERYVCNACFLGAKKADIERWKNGR